MDRVNDTSAAMARDDGAQERVGAAPSARRPWRRPRILGREQIEAVAADCGAPLGKSDPTCLIPFS